MAPGGVYRTCNLEARLAYIVAPIFANANIGPCVTGRKCYCVFMNNNIKTLPVDLHDAYAWTEAAGELETLASLTGEELVEYAIESAHNAWDHGEHDVFPLHLRDLATWLCSA